MRSWGGARYGPEALAHEKPAVCEHEDNAIHAGASEIRVYVRQAGDAVIDAAIYDDGRGTVPTALKVATSFDDLTCLIRRR